MSKTKKQMPKWLDITLKVIEWTLIIVIVSCMLVLLSQKITGNTPELFGYSTYTVVTNSMEGTYDVGDVVLCKRIKDTLGYMENTGFKKDDVIAFIAPYGFDQDNKLQGQTITHRIYEDPFYDEETDTWYVWTKGDAVPTRDRVPVPVENIQGIIVGSSKAVSKIMNFITKWYGFATIIVIPLLAILVWQIWILIREKTKASKKEMEQERVKTLKEIEEENNLKVEEIKKQAIKDYEDSLKNEKERRKDDTVINENGSN